jgi:hypothetical protein
VSDPTVDQAASHRGKITLGAVVFAGLICLDVLEYIVAQTAQQVLVWMALLAVPQAALIAVFYMHVRQLRGRDR